MTQLVIRRARVGEAAALTAIAQASKAYWPYSASQIAAWQEALTITDPLIESGLTWVASDDGGMAGLYVLAPARPHWTLEHFWVLPERMRQGIGRALLGHALSTALQGGASGILIDADPNAESFYQACGATRTGEIAAPIDEAPQRTRPQLVLSGASPSSDRSLR